ncbi:MAG: hypothetical protein O7H41_14875 [Planctomycetota bacterium]|nr:hypothetical protein [Planctomycetota bacterium]
MGRSAIPPVLLLCAVLGCASAPPPAVLPPKAIAATPDVADAPTPEPPIEVGDWLVLGPLPGWGRRPFAPNPLAEQYLLSGEAWAPKEGDTVTWPRNGTVTWRRLDSGDDAGRALRNGFAFATLDLPAAGRFILEGKGTTVTWVNGDPVVGDVYHKGRLRVPVRLRKGENHILARAVRGGLQVRLVPAEGPIEFNLRDVMLPHHREDVPLDSWGAIPVLNTLDRWITGASIQAGGTDHIELMTEPIPPLAPLGVCKVPFRIRCRDGGHPVAAEDKSFELPIAVRWEGGSATTTLRVGVARQGQTYVETFISGIDGSVQHYAVRPPPRIDPGWEYALILTLHGAGVGAHGQANAYVPKDWAFVVAPTNRRSFGFDWEDWGRLDALEVLAEVQKRYPIDRDRVLLGGHSMGDTVSGTSE